MEILYSTTILAFLSRIKKMALKILSEEMGIKTGRSRFVYKGYSYPLHIIVFDHPSKLGTFHPDLFEIGVNKMYLMEEEDAIQEVLRHELAHLATFLKYGKDVPSHGKEFRTICKEYGWPEKVSKASVTIEQGVKRHRIAEKVRKLLSLSESPHPKEAEEAALKAQYLLDKYNVSYTPPSEEETVLLRILERKRGSAKLQAIASILKSYYVYPVFNRGKEGVYLEVIGERLSVEVADYVSHFLDRQFESLWKEAKKETPSLKGTISKNSFFRGLAEGYLSKAIRSKSLIRTEKSLIEKAQKIYPHLSSTTTAFRHSEKGARLGKEKGRKMTIAEGLKEKFRPFLLARKY